MLFWLKSDELTTVLYENRVKNSGSVHFLEPKNTSIHQPSISGKGWSNHERPGALSILSS